ncbi:MAG: hypothetical protein DMF57_04705 [Acidobacteria bacterium]|nr:MAG: hypothetical protein DMF57_04705 [Acidobacteriota bacterium]
MLRKSLLSLCILLIALFAVADKKKTKGSGSSTTTTVATSTTQITASEGSTAMAIRGIVEPEGAMNAAVLGVVNGVATGRVRQSGRTFKFNVPANVAFKAGDAINADPNAATMACCNIAAINSATHVITVNEPAVGRTFQFKLGSVDGLRAGQAVEADFKAGTAWIAGNAALKSSIANLSAPTGLHP